MDKSEVSKGFLGNLVMMHCKLGQRACLPFD